jgi:hypothetical protein
MASAVWALATGCLALVYLGFGCWLVVAAVNPQRAMAALERLPARRQRWVLLMVAGACFLSSVGLAARAVATIWLGQIHQMLS